MLNNGWNEILADYLKSANYLKLIKEVDKLYDSNICYPKYEEIYAALNMLKYEDVKVVIIGQDPYHGEGEAHGLAFSVRQGVKIPPSLRNIFKELYSDLGITRLSTDLSDWEEQGILLLNSCLTVTKDTPGSHKDIGWQEFTDYIIKKINEKNEPVVFLLWGNYAIGKEKLITNPIHHVIKSAHPSPLSASRGFFGSKPFSKINEYLEKDYKKTIHWG